MRWKLPEFVQPFKLGSPKGSLDQVSAFVLDIVNEIIIQDVSSKSKLSTRKYKPMMALDDEVEAEWAVYIFTRLLESIPRFHAVKK